jgi:4-amino-4-deoxy-L-arabinose transferase-like glycosyltransferase
MQVSEQFGVARSRVDLALRSLTLSSYAGRAALITVIGLVVRLAWVGREPIWRDEAFTAIVEQKSIGGMLEAVRNDSAPPLSYLLTHVFVAFMGPTPQALRFSSVIVGTLLVPIVAALARRCAGDRAGLLAASVSALAPSLVMSSRDARMYATATTLVAFSTLALWRAVERPTVLRWLVYGVALLLALYTQYFAILAIPAQLIAIRFVLHTSWRTAVVAAGVSAVALAGLVPWLVYAAPQFRHAETPFWVSPLSLKTIGGTAAQFLSGPPIEPGTQGLVALQALQGLAVLAGIVCAYLLIRGRNRLGRPAGFVALCSVGPVFLLAAVSVWHPLLEARYASVVWGPLFAIIAVAIACLNRARLQVLVAAALVVPTMGFSVAVTHPDTPAVTAYLDPRVQANDFVWSSASDYLLLLYYGDDDLRTHTHVVARHIAWFWGTAAFPPDALTPAFPAATLREGGTIYWVDDAGHRLPAPPAGYFRQQSNCFSTICVTTFTPRSA